MFDRPTRNHASIILERAGAVLALLAVMGANSLKDYGWDIFRPSFYKELFLSAVSGGKTVPLIAAGIALFMIWYSYISFRYWKRTTFYIDGVDFVYERKTMFKAASRLPIKNIAVVNVERNVFERLIGTGKVKIDLNSSRTAGSTDFQFVLKKDKAQALKETLMQIKQTVTAEEVPEIQTEPEQRELIAHFGVAEALRHKLLSMPVIQSAVTLTVLFILPQMKVSGDYDMSRLWFLLIIAIIGWVGSMVKGTLDLGDYKVERDGELLYISCGVLNKRHYMLETEKINAVMVNQPLLARFFGMSSVNLAVVGLGNEKNETTHLSLIADKAQTERILQTCVPDFVCTGTVQRCHPINLLYTIPRAIALGALTLLIGFVYRKAFIFAGIVLIVALLGAVSEFCIQRFAQDDRVVQYTSGMFNKRSGMFKYGDIQNIQIRTNLLYRKFGLGRMRFTILASASVSSHKTGLFKMDGFDRAAALMIAHEDSILSSKHRKERADNS